MRTLAVVLALVGCTGDPDGTLPPGGDEGDENDNGEQVVHGTPRECEGVISLHGMSETGSAGQVEIPSKAYDVDGEYLCLELDARDNIHIAHFAANTIAEQASASSFEIALLAPDETMLRDGWDVTYGNGNAFASLEYGITDRVVIEAKLRVRAKSATATSAVRLYLFEPYE